LTPIGFASFNQKRQYVGDSIPVDSAKETDLWTEIKVTLRQIKKLGGTLTSLRRVGDGIVYLGRIGSAVEVN
jgi:hypothetical protein